MYHISIKLQAIKYRKKGYSIKNIAKLLGIAKSTSSLWLREINMGKKAIRRIDKRSRKSRGRGAEERKRRLGIQYKIIEDIVKSDLERIKLTKLHARLLCAFLYWGEGAKRQKAIKFMNSDPALITVFLKLFRESFPVREDRLRATLHLHEYHNQKERLLFCSKITKIPMNQIGIYNKPNTGKRLRAEYPGCISINYSDSKIFTALTSYYKYFSLGA
jgi:predicted transcriptional regulator